MSSARDTKTMSSVHDSSVSDIYGQPLRQSHSAAASLTSGTDCSRLAKLLGDLTAKRLINAHTVFLTDIQAPTRQGQAKYPYWWKKISCRWRRISLTKAMSSLLSYSLLPFNLTWDTKNIHEGATTWFLSFFVENALTNILTSRMSAAAPSIPVVVSVGTAKPPIQKKLLRSNLGACQLST